MEQRRALKSRRSISHEEERKYKQANAPVQRQVRRDKAAWIAEQCMEVEEELLRNNPKRPYEVITKRVSPKTTQCQRRQRAVADKHD